MSYNEIADSLESTTENVRSYIQNGRRKLRKCMKNKFKSNVGKE